MLDRSQIEQVLINLLKNAGEACIEQEIPEVIIATHYEMEKRIFMLTVTDNGSGILPDVLDKICCQLECQLNDIAEIIPDKEEH